jgi:sugar lactone lactonase YvrE
MKRWKQRLVLNLVAPVLLAVLFVHPVWAASLSGVVTSGETGRGINGVLIQTSAGDRYTTTTATFKLWDGYYSIDPHPTSLKGPYTITASKIGYLTQSKNIFIDNLNTAYTLNFELSAAVKALTGSATNITSGAAVLHGTVNPAGLATTYYFEYGLTAAYGKATASQSAGSGTSDVNVSAALSGDLLPGTTCHYRLVATNSVGTRRGNDAVFTTLEEFHEYDRMWPTLQQPWYFTEPLAVAVDRTGFVYVADDGYSEIRKYTADGHFVTKWGSYGSGDGQFKGPSAIAFDSLNYVYVADTSNCRIQKFTASGKFVAKWGTKGSGNGQLDSPGGIAVGPKDEVFVADTKNNRIQKFTSRGTFIAKWTTFGLSYPTGIAADLKGSIYVVDKGNNRVVKLTSTGTYVTGWGGSGTTGGKFSSPNGIAVDKKGYVYVADTGNTRIQKFTSTGAYIRSWGAKGLEEYQGFLDGEFRQPIGVAVDGQNNVYVADRETPHIQKFTKDGGFITKWGSGGAQRGMFFFPAGAAVDGSGNVYAVDVGNHRIQKFDGEGRFLREIGSYGTADGQFTIPTAMALDSADNIYVVDYLNDRIQVFTPGGSFLRKWKPSATGTIQGIAIDGKNNVYVILWNADFRLKKFSSTGTLLANLDLPDMTPYAVAVGNDDRLFIAGSVSGAWRVRRYSVGTGLTLLSDWGGTGAEDGQFNKIRGLGVDSEGYVYVADYNNSRIQKFTKDGVFASKFGEPGNGAGQFVAPYGVAVGSSGKIYCTDEYANRIMVFQKVSQPTNAKAIVVAGGGPYKGNALWDATRMVANLAYRTLQAQGFTADKIYYLSEEAGLDLNGDGIPDVDADPTKAALEWAIKVWAAGAGSLTVVLNDHGGSGSFRMNENEILTAPDLDAWLDYAQQGMAGVATVIVDACESGSLVPALVPPAGKQRIVITSTSAGEGAQFAGQGSLSFSTPFWVNILNGRNVKDAFLMARETVQTITDYAQNPVLNDNGNGIGNEAGDGALAAVTYIGNGNGLEGGAPTIAAVSGDQVISGNTATLSAYGVTDGDGIARVWAVILPPGYSQPSPDNPVQEYPTIDLEPVEGEDDYTVAYDGFQFDGTYQIAIYARDRMLNTSQPYLTTVSVNLVQKRKAIVAAGGTASDVLWPGRERAVQLAYQALAYQGYRDEDIYLMSPASIPGISKAPVLPTLSNFDHAVNMWAQTETYDLVLYLIGPGNYYTFMLNPTEGLHSQVLKGWLDGLQAVIPGPVAVIYDADYAGSLFFTGPPAPPSGLIITEDPPAYERILITSTNNFQRAQTQEDASFSWYFWNQVFNGLSVRDAFLYAKNAVEFTVAGQTPQLDDNKNKAGNDPEDGQLAVFYKIGMGIQLAGNDPLGGAVVSERVLHGETSSEIWIDNVTATGGVESVWAVVNPPVPVHTQAGELPMVALLDDGTGRYSGVYDGFDLYGLYKISIYVRDANGNVSLPRETTVFQSMGTDVYEEDDAPAMARVIIVPFCSKDEEAPPCEGEGQTHNFDSEGDQDWVKFYANAGYTYEIRASDFAPTQCDPRIVLYDRNASTVLGWTQGDVPLTWTCPAGGSGIYYVKVYESSGRNGAGTGYDLSVYHTDAGLPGQLMGMVVEGSGSGVGEAVVKSTTTNIGTLSLDSGFYMMVLPSGTHNMEVAASGYQTLAEPGVVIQSSNTRYQGFIMTASGIPGDRDGDGDVDAKDLADLATEFGRTGCGSPDPCDFDLNSDGRVDGADLILFLQKFGW